MSRPRRPLVGGNWKMHFDRAEAEAYCRRLLEIVASPPADVVLLPSFPILDCVGRLLAGSAVAWGGQDLHTEDEGPHTGDVSGTQLADLGCRWALCGHSERRRDHGEDDALVAAKAQAAHRHRLTPWICIGETADERRQGRTFEVLERQLRGALDPPPASFALAYEPVWAIGTGETASPSQVEEAHTFLRATLQELLGAERARQVRIAYGGSVKPDNAVELFAPNDVDGFLVGGASLDAEAFRDIIESCSV